jgi:uncharacterized protein (TIGR02001 family)
MIKQSALALAALVGGVSVQAQEASALSVTVDVTYVSDYVFRGAQLDNASIQPSIEAAYGDFYAGIWHSTALKSRLNGTETDLYAGYGFALSDTFSLDVGITRYLYEAASGDDSTEAYIGLSADVLLSPSVYYYYDFDNETSSYIASIGYSLPVDAINASLDFSGTFGFIQKPAGQDYTYGSVGAAVPFALSETATLTVGGEWVINDTRALQSGKRQQLVGSIGVSIGF